MKYEAITLAKFLSRYACLGGVDLTKITHKDVKTLFPYLTRVSFEQVENDKRLLSSGKVVLVTDGKHTIPYLVPQLDVNCDMDIMEVSLTQEPELVKDDTLYDYASMSEYELRQLLIRKFNSVRNQYAARRELEKRGIAITKKYKRSDYKNKREE